MNMTTPSIGTSTGSCQCSVPAAMPVLFKSFLAAAMPVSRDVVTWLPARIPRFRRTSATLAAPLI
jgi:hypothetical protein